ncbi:MAG: hypothetical protein U1E65_04110 [Myxococcota bacterium]
MRRAAISLLLSAGCAHPAIRDLSVAPPVSPAPLRPCRIRVEPLVDARPEAERQGGTQTSLTLLVPLVGWAWFQSSAGFRQQTPETIGAPHAVEDLTRALESTVETSGLCSLATREETPTHVLEGRVLHLYGVGYFRRAFKQLLLAYVTNDVQAFLPAGQATLELSLHHAQEVQRFRLEAQSICDPSQDGSPAYADTEDQSSAVVARAALEALSALPAELARALSELGAPGPGPSPEQFRIQRLSADRAFLELATLNAQTGAVLDEVVIERHGPVYAEPGEWVVALEQPSRLSRAQYLALIEALGKRFDVRFEGNLTAARFFGLR